MTTTAPEGQPSTGVVRGVSPIEEVIDEARRCRPYILVDAEDRENEGDIIIPAQCVTPEHISFMAIHARGLICLAITEERARQLRLTPMVAENNTSLGTAFTYSIDAREGITTGISAADRALTVQTAVDPRKGPDDIAAPGHVFPLVAKRGGVLARAGHTEAAVDIARIAGLNPSAVICEVLRDDGSMARLPDLLGFAEVHDLKVGTIADLIAYRRRTERHVRKLLETPFDSVHGEFTLHIYQHVVEGVEYVALTRGTITPDTTTLVRMHQIDFAADLLGHKEARRDYVPSAMLALAHHPGPGALVFVRDGSQYALSKRYAEGFRGKSYEDGPLRDYGVGAQILLDLGIRDMVLMTSSEATPVALEGYGLRIVNRVPVPGPAQARPRLRKSSGRGGPR